MKTFFWLGLIAPSALFIVWAVATGGSSSEHSRPNIAERIKTACDEKLGHAGIEEVNKCRVTLMLTWRDQKERDALNAAYRQAR